MSTLVGIRTDRIRLPEDLAELIRPDVLTLYHMRRSGETWLNSQRADFSERLLLELGFIAERRAVALARELHLLEGGAGTILLAFSSAECRVWAAQSELLLYHDGMHNGGRLENALSLAGIRYRQCTGYGLGVKNLLWTEAPRMVTAPNLEGVERQMREIESYIHSFRHFAQEQGREPTSLAKLLDSVKTPD